MQHLFRLRNAVKNYEWGSPDWIPALVGAPNPMLQPCAELWMGAHPTSPSMADTGAGEIPLNTLVARNPLDMIGRKTAETFGALPFLFKLLAAAKPLSIQAHPSLEQAKEGWARENAAGIPPDAPNRNYKDANHKPEILCALTPFRAMCGFREVAEIARLLDLLAVDELAAARKTLDAADAETALRAFLEAIFALSPIARVNLGRSVKSRARTLAAQKSGDSAVWNLVLSFVAAYPADPAIIAPLYLNVLDLESGEAIYLPAGILHAYVEGFGVELMANSDNVLRGGLTPKHVDVAELTRTLHFAPFHPEVLRPVTEGEGFARYRTPSAEFSLSRSTSSGKTVPLPGREPHILVITAGSAVLADGNEQVELKRGESVFVAAGAETPTLKGSFQAFIASVGNIGGDGAA